MEKGPFVLEKMSEKMENIRIRDHFMKSLEESQNFYKDIEFDKFTNEDFKEESQMFISEKITDIANHKLTKNIKK